MNVMEPLSSNALAALDAAYRPFPAFADWPAYAPRPDMWASALAALESAKENASEPDFARATQTAIRAAAFDTGAIEHLYKTDRGLTITVATQAAAWEATVNRQSPNALALFKAQLRAYQLVLDVATQSLPITGAWIRRLHEELTEPQETYTVQTPVGPQEQPLPRGRYKEYPNHVELGNGESHSYAPVLDTPAEMERLVKELSSPAFLEADPVLQASYVHYAFVIIHPFADGNGRVARALASVYLYRAATIPLLIFVDQQDPYLASLEAADKGTHEAFVHFVAATSRSTMALVAESIHTKLTPDLDDSARALRQIITPGVSLSEKELREVGRNLGADIERLVAERVAALDLPGGVTVKAALYEDEPLISTRPKDGPVFLITLTSALAPPVDVKIESVVHFQLPEEADPECACRIVDNAERQAAVELALGDLYPALTVASELRLRGFVERWLAFDIDKLREAVATRLHSSPREPLDP